MIVIGLFQLLEMFLPELRHMLELSMPEPLGMTLDKLERIPHFVLFVPSTQVDGAVARAFSACLRFLPATSKEKAERLLVEAMSLGLKMMMTIVSASKVI